MHIERHDAALKMEATGLAPAVRSGALSRTRSRLYQGGPYLIDMMITVEGESSRLVGQVLPHGVGDLPASGTVAMFGSAGEPKVAPLAPGGFFRFDIPGRGGFGLEVRFPRTCIHIPEIRQPRAG